MQKVSLMLALIFCLFSPLIAMEPRESTKELTLMGLLKRAPYDIQTLVAVPFYDLIRSDLIEFLTRHPIKELVDESSDHYVSQIAFDPKGGCCIAVRK